MTTVYANTMKEYHQNINDKTVTCKTETLTGKSERKTEQIRKLQRAKLNV